ncbi:MAG: hypothetical protein AAGA30_08180, partial [Planctomycetota bacterium]
MRQFLISWATKCLLYPILLSTAALVAYGQESANHTDDNRQTELQQEIIFIQNLIRTSENAATEKATYAERLDQIQATLTQCELDRTEIEQLQTTLQSAEKIRSQLDSDIAAQKEMASRKVTLAELDLADLNAKQALIQTKLAELRADQQRVNQLVQNFQPSKERIVNELQDVETKVNRLNTENTNPLLNGSEPGGKIEQLEFRVRQYALSTKQTLLQLQ